MSKPSVTLRDIYEIVDRLEGKMDDRLSKIEGRTDSLETYRDRAVGVLSIFTLFTGFISSWIWERIIKNGN